MSKLKKSFKEDTGIDVDVLDSSSRVTFTLDEFSTHYNPEDFKKGECDFVFKISFSNTREIIAMFRVKDQVGCAGILIANDLMVVSPYRKRGIATAIVEFIEEFSKNFGYGLVQATDLTSNDPIRRIITKRGWITALSFVNAKTNNNLSLYLYNEQVKTKEASSKEARKIILVGEQTEEDHIQ